MNTRKPSMSAPAISSLTEQEFSLWLEDLFEEHYQLLFNIGLLFMASAENKTAAIQDEIQEVFLIAWKKRKQLITHPNIGGWLVEALRLRLKKYFSALNKEKMRLAFSLDNPNAPPVAQKGGPYPSPEEFLTTNEQMALLENLLGTENAHLFYGYCVEGRSSQALAEEYHLTDNCVRMRVSRMKKKILANSQLFFTLALLLLARRLL